MNLYAQCERYLMNHSAQLPRSWDICKAYECKMWLGDTCQATTLAVYETMQLVFYDALYYPDTMNWHDLTPVKQWLLRWAILAALTPYQGDPLESPLLY